MSKTDSLRIPDYLDHILQALKRIFEYMDDIDELGFLNNPMMQDAVLRNIEVIGEAARNLVRHHSEFTAQYANIPWEDMYWMRNRISHGYFSIDFEIVWKTIERDFPLLQKEVQLVYEEIIGR